MAKVYIPAQWRDLTGTTAQLDLDGNSLKQIVDALERKYDAQFRVVFDAIRRLMAPPPDPPRGRIGFHPPSRS